MNGMRILLSTAAVAVLLLVTASAKAASVPFTFSTGNPDGLIATASRPASAGKIETETADDFVLTNQTKLNSATFTGLLTGDVTTASIPRVTVDIYRVFPNESDATRTPGVPTRMNSPGDVELVGRDTAAADMTFTSTVINPSFNAANSVINNITVAATGTTGGEGAVTGQEVQVNVTFTTPLDLAADHYFFRPEVEVTGGEFLWLSAAKPIVAPGTPFNGDLQTWTRNETIKPDWMRIGTDIVGAPEGGSAPTFNASFSLSGETTSVEPPPPTGIPFPSAFWPGMTLLGALGLMKARSRRKIATCG
jgi:hypothetical protein